MDEQRGFNLEEVLFLMKNAPNNIFFLDIKCKYVFVLEIYDLVNVGKDYHWKKLINKFKK